LGKDENLSQLLGLANVLNTDFKNEIFEKHAKTDENLHVYDEK